MARVTVNTAPEPEVTSMYSLSIIILKFPIAENGVADVTVIVVCEVLAATDKVLLALFTNCSIAMSHFNYNWKICPGPVENCKLISPPLGVTGSPGEPVAVSKQAIRFAVVELPVFLKNTANLALLPPDGAATAENVRFADEAFPFVDDFDARLTLADTTLAETLAYTVSARLNV